MKKVSVEPEGKFVQRLVLLPRQTGKTAGLRCPQCSNVTIKYVNTQIGYWCSRCSYQGTTIQVPAKLTILTCPRCGSSDIRGPGKSVSSAHKNWCAHCGYHGIFEIRDADEPDCKLDDAELRRDQDTLKDVLTKKQRRAL